MEPGTLIAFILTLLVFSYLLGDNILYRLAIYVFVGVAAAFTVVVTFESVLLPLFTPQAAPLLVTALILTGLLLAKPIAGLAPVTNLALAFLIAVGAAVAIVGAVTGTLIPLALSTGQLNQGTLLEGLLVFIGVVATLLYFQTTARRRADGFVQRGPINRVIAGLGELVILVTLGALYGGAILTSLTILTGRIAYLLQVGG